MVHKLRFKFEICPGTLAFDWVIAFRIRKLTQMLRFPHFLSCFGIWYIANYWSSSKSVLVDWFFSWVAVLVLRTLTQIFSFAHCFNARRYSLNNQSMFIVYHYSCSLWFSVNIKFLSIVCYFFRICYCSLVHCSFTSIFYLHILIP